MKPLSLILVLALGLSGCSSLSKSAQQQRAYQKYVRKSMANRTRQQAKVAKSRTAEIPSSEAGPAEAKVTTEGPQAVPSEQASQ